MIYQVFANRSNAGDWLSAWGIQELVAPLAVEELLCDEPFVPATLRALGRATTDDFVIIGGGGLFMDYFTPFWKGFNEVSQRVPFAIWGVGCCAVKHNSSAPPWQLLSEIVARSRFCVVRDELTRRQLASNSLPPPTPCPTFVAVSPRSVVSSHRILHVDHYDNVGAEVFARMEQIAGDFAIRTGRTHARTNNLLPAGDHHALQSVLDLYASADVILSSRLHGCILALGSKRRIVALSGDRKVEAFMVAAGLKEWVCGLDEVERLPGLLDRIDQQKFPTDFVCEARRANCVIGQSIRSLVSELAPSTSLRRFAPAQNVIG